MEAIEIGEYMTGFFRASLGAPARRYLPVVAVLLFALAACGPSAPAGPLTFSGIAHGTDWSVTIVEPPGDLEPATVRKAIHEVLARVDAQIWANDSAINRFNRTDADVWAPVPAELAGLVGDALAIGRETAGAFDITRLPLLQVWGVAGTGRPGAPPSARQIRLAREQTGIGLIEVRDEPPALRKKRAGLTLHLAEIAPGYVIKRLTERLDALGAGHYRIEFGDTLYVRGNNAQGRPWTVKLKRPQTADRPMRIELSDVGMASAGGHPYSIVLGGRRFSQPIDPRTGRPVAHDLRSVAVVAADVMRAGALARALLVMGTDAALAYANAHDVAALFMSRDAGTSEMRHSKALEAYMRSGAATE